MMTMKSCLLVVFILTVLAGAVGAEEPVARERVWGLGWDGGKMVLRHRMGLWEVAVSGGPDDNLSDRRGFSFGPDYPDSLQGLMTLEEHTNRESGIVGLDISRQCAQYGDFIFSGMVGGSYFWSDNESEFRSYSRHYEGYRENIETWFKDEWSVRLGCRVVWYPLPFISVETSFGLRYAWEAEDRTIKLRDPDEDVWSVTKKHNSYQSFSDFGLYDLIDDLRLTVWF